MNVLCLRIDPDGTVIEYTDPDLLGLAHAEFEETDVVVLRSPWYDERVLPDGAPPLVGVIYDWGRDLGLPLNVKAWALYGRSPICGPMWIALDSEDDGRRRPLPPGLLSAVRHDRFPRIPPAGDDIIDLMRSALATALANGESNVPDAGLLPE